MQQVHWSGSKDNLRNCGFCTRATYWQCGRFEEDKVFENPQHEGI